MITIDWSYTNWYILGHFHLRQILWKTASKYLSSRTTAVFEGGHVTATKKNKNQSVDECYMSVVLMSFRALVLTVHPKKPILKFSEPMLLKSVSLTQQGWYHIKIVDVL